MKKVRCFQEHKYDFSQTCYIVSSFLTIPVQWSLTSMLDVTIVAAVVRTESAEAVVRHPPSLKGSWSGILSQKTSHFKLRSRTMLTASSQESEVTFEFLGPELLTEYKTNSSMDYRSNAKKSTGNQNRNFSLSLWNTNRMT